MDPFPRSKQDSKARRESLEMSLPTREFCLLPKMMPGPVCMDLGSKESVDTGWNWRILQRAWGGSLYIWVVSFLREKLKHFSSKLEKYMLKLLLLCLQDAHMHMPNNFGTTQKLSFFRHCQQQQSSLASDTVSLHLMVS